MHFLAIYIGLCIIFFPLMLILFKISPYGWEDENGFHHVSEKEELITFPLKKKIAISHFKINFKFAHYQKLDQSNSNHPITLSL
ncbi:MAG: hypothetical protein WB779_12895 [Ignavibacteriaceae bacterium]